MTNEEKAREIVTQVKYLSDFPHHLASEEDGALRMAEWKDKQLRERLDFEIERANAYYDKQLNRHELDKHIGAVIVLSELLGIKFPADRLHMRFATMD